MFCTLDDLLKRYSEDYLIQISSKTDIIDTEAEDIINQAINDASNEIKVNSSHYKLDLEKIPDLISKLCCEITIRNLLQRIDQSIGETFDNRVNWINQTLNKLSRGELDIETIETEDPNTLIKFTSDLPRGW